MRKLGDQWAIPCSIIRGGTSKGVYFLEEDLPENPQRREIFLKRALGNPGAAQLDGLGGGKINTSKVAIIKRSARSDADIDYTFGEVSLTEDKIDYSGTCGNIIAGVGVFALLKKLIQPSGLSFSIRIFNTNIDSIITATYCITDDVASSQGDYFIDGLGCSGSEIKLDFAHTVGAKTKKLLPSGRVQDEIVLSSGQKIIVSLCDVSNPCVFLDASNVGLKGDESPDNVTRIIQEWGFAEELRGRAAMLMGIISDWRKVNEYFDYLPFVTLIGSGAEGSDITARVILQNQCYSSMPVTGMICLAAASAISGSVVANYNALSTGCIRIAHPLGVTEIECRTRSQDGELRFDYLGCSRTARLLMNGEVFLPDTIII